VDHDRNVRNRLERLEQRLAQREPLQRLADLTAAMPRAYAEADDPLERVTMRLMLEDYMSMLSQFRATVRTAEEQLSSVAAVVTDGQRLVRGERKRQSR
jgi:hypothetical protein